MHKVIPVFDHSQRPNISRMPEWIRQPLGDGEAYGSTAHAVHANTLHTVCEEARCPNRGECWSRGTATFMLLGDTCTRACGFCAVKTGRPDWHDTDEPRRVAEAALAMGLDYVVLTSVNRDDLPDGGAGVFADTVRALRAGRPGIGVELLTPDFKHRQTQALAIIHASIHRRDHRGIDTVDTYQGMDAGVPATSETHKPAHVRLVWGHNVETVPSLYRTVRKGADYGRSLSLLAQAARLDGVEAKSALMLGLGEDRGEVLAVLRDLRDAGVQRLSLGQYLRPTRYHLPVLEYLAPEAFDDYATEARAMGFSWVKAGPLVRSSYHAEEQQQGARA